MDTKTSLTPFDVESSGSQIFDISFHPSDDFIAVATIVGVVEVFKYGNQSIPNQLINKFSSYSSSCRGVSFTEDGCHLITISSDKSWKRLDGTGQVTNYCNNAHDEAINKITLLHSMPTCFVTGDDSGSVKLWDSRTNNNDKSEVMSWKVHEDYISDLLYIPDSNTLLSTSGDSTLCMYDIRKKNVYEQSDEQESELTCLQCIKHNRKVVAGTQLGVVLVFSWGKWGDCSDRYPGHPETVDCITKIDESMILTGSSDGLIRVVSLLPNKILGVVGDHEDFPVEGMRRNHTGRLLASYSHDHRVRFWDLSMFVDDVGDEDEEGHNSDLKSCPTPAAGVEMEEMDLEGEDEEGCDIDEDADAWEDIESGSGKEDIDVDDGEDEEEDSDDDDKSSNNNSKPNSSNRGKNNSFQSATEKFYADL